MTNVTCLQGIIGAPARGAPAEIAPVAGKPSISTTLSHKVRQLIAGSALIMMTVALAACQPEAATPAPTSTPTPSPTRTATPAPTLTSTPVPVDYAPMIAQINEYLGYTARKYGYDLGIGFVDIQTGQTVSIDGETRYHAMSSFKGPLAAFYLWLVERGEIEERAGDSQHIQRMLEVSNNVDTTCVFQRVGGIAPFNDWLAEEQGLSRENNFVLRWQDWPCVSEESYYVPEPDLRYTLGDDALGLPGGGELLECPIPQLPCDKAFAPLELAGFYARLYRGEVLNADNTALLLSWMEEGRDETVFLNHLPADAEVTVYVKGGTHEADEIYRVNFFNEAGIIETPYGAFALALFMQRNPEWPGTSPMSEVARIVYAYFVEMYGVEPTPTPG